MSDRDRAGGAPRLALDCIVALMFWVLAGVPAVAVGRLAGRAGWLPDLAWWQWALLPPLALAFLVGLLLTATVVRALLPRLEPGRYPFPRHPQSFVWLLHFSLQRLVYLPAWRYLACAFSTLRWAMLRALGARAAFDMDASSDVLVLDPPLVTLRAGTMIGAGCTLTGHLIEHGTLLLARIEIGEGVELASSVVVGPGVAIGEHATIGPGCRLAAEAAIGAFAFLGASCSIGPCVKVGAHAVVGHEVGMGQGVVVGEGAVIASGTRIPRGTVIAAGAHHPTATGGVVA